jgi:iojap-like ribosome-associated protein
MKDQSKEMARLTYEALDEKKAEDITVLEIGDISVLADYFIIANGTNSSQVQALVDNVQEVLGKNGYLPKRIEGVRSTNWVLLDYGDVVVHVFSKEDRLFYDLERIWRDGKRVTRGQLEE